jgi:hypothetical protein
MTIQEFATLHKLKAPVSHDTGDTLISGKLGDICAYDPEGMAFLVYFLGTGKSAKGWNDAKRVLTEAGLTLHQDGDWEGSFILTDPTNTNQVRAVRRCLKVPLKRVLSPEHRARLRKVGERSRFG